MLNKTAQNVSESRQSTCGGITLNVGKCLRTKNSKKRPNTKIESSNTPNASRNLKLRICMFYNTLEQALTFHQKHVWTAIGYVLRAGAIKHVRSNSDLSNIFPVKVMQVF